MSNTSIPEVVLVTGAAGFIGSHVTDFLLTNGYRVIGLDSLVYGSLKNIENSQSKNFTFIEKDIGNLNLSEATKILSNVDYLIHLAAEKHNNSKNDFEKIINSNCTGSATLFQAAVTNEVKKIVFSSSLYAYGNYHSMSMNETDVCSPDTYYGASKLMGEMLLRTACKSSNTHFSILRLFFTYGPRQYPGLGYPSVIVKNFDRLQHNENPIIVNNGAQTLDYVYIDDVVNVITECMKKKKSSLLNVGTGKGTSIKLLTQIMCECAGSDLLPVYQGSDWTKDTIRVANNNRLISELGWKPIIDVRDGLNLTLADLQKNLSTEEPQ